jgi:hypothetical protein
MPLASGGVSAHKTISPSDIEISSIWRGKSKIAARFGAMLALKRLIFIIKFSLF